MIMSSLLNKYRYFWEIEYYISSPHCEYWYLTNYGNIDSNFVMSISIPCYTIIVNVTFVIKTAQRYFLYLITSKLVVLISDCFHFMLQLSVVKLCVLIVFILDTFFLWHSFWFLSLFYCLCNCLSCMSTSQILNQQIHYLEYRQLHP